MASARSFFLTLVTLFAALLCSTDYAAAYSSIVTERALYVLNRLGYGPRPGDVARVAAMGVSHYVDRQLDPSKVPESAPLEKGLAQLTTLRMSPAKLFRLYGPPKLIAGVPPDREAAKRSREKASIIVRELLTARIERALESNRQLQEVMTEFWLNHFNILSLKSLDYLWIGAFEENAIRPYALGKFRDLLEATAKSPAMQIYLDNWLNVAPSGNRGINENYAREVMELHTLGADGGYTQADVITLAHIFTGWGIPVAGLRRGEPVDPSAFAFDPARHDNADKIFLGRPIKVKGEAEGELALDMLARSPATAHHIAFQLAQYFVSDYPDPGLVRHVAATFLKSNGNIAATLRTLFSDERFWGAERAQPKFKTPYRYVMSSLRLCGISSVNSMMVQRTLAHMGMPLYGYPGPEGYKYIRASWLNSDAIAKRIAFALSLADGQSPVEINSANGMANGGTISPVHLKDLRQTYGNLLSSNTEAAIHEAPEPVRAAMFLASPEFMQY
jgi:uncharacterized protein (DUF1800 family)